MSGSKGRKSLTPDQLHEMIASRAYLKYVDRGYLPGDPKEDWLAAEAEVLARLEAADEPYEQVIKVRTGAQQEGKRAGAAKAPANARKANKTPLKTGSSATKKKAPGIRKPKAKE